MQGAEAVQGVCRGTDALAALGCPAPPLANRRFASRRMPGGLICRSEHPHSNPKPRWAGGGVIREADGVSLRAVTGEVTAGSASRTATRATAQDAPCPAEPGCAKRPADRLAGLLVQGAAPGSLFRGTRKCSEYTCTQSAPFQVVLWSHQHERRAGRVAYAIMRFEKHKASNVGALAGSLSHTFRSRYTPNAQPERSQDNRVWLGPEDPQEVAEAIRARWPEKYRRDAVGAVEFFIGASPEWFQEHGGAGDQEAYFQRAIEWLQAHYGPENVVSVVQHNDETTPHLAAYVVPIRPDTGALSAKWFADGRRGCSELQTSFHRAAGEPVGLERGVQGSKAEHTSIRRWYEEQANLDQRREQIAAEAADFDDRREDAMNYLVGREQAIDRREDELEKASAELSKRERDLDTREARVEAEQSEAARLGASMAAREAKLAQREATAVQQHAAEADRLERLRVELEARGERLAGGEAALEQRQAEIDRTGQQLRERVEKLREIDGALEDKKQVIAARESALEAWARQHAPEGVDAFADAPRPLPAGLRSMAGKAAADWHDAGIDQSVTPPPRGSKGPEG